MIRVIIIVIGMIVHIIIITASMVVAAVVETSAIIAVSISISVPAIPVTVIAITISSVAKWKAANGAHIGSAVKYGRTKICQLSHLAVGPSGLAVLSGLQRVGRCTVIID